MKLRFAFLALLFAFPVYAEPGPDAAQAERDTVYMLAAYSHVYRDWQTPDMKPGRGHNIGSVLVDPDGKVVFAARNCSLRPKLQPYGQPVARPAGNSTDHGEVMLMQWWLIRNNLHDLRGYTIYTTLEPCAQCSGMMIMAEVRRTVYGQTDPDFGKALERLQADNSAKGGWGPYPRPVKSELSTSAFCKRLNDAYAVGKKSASLTEWLRGDDAKAIYADADKAFREFKPVAAKNEYETAKKLLEDLNK